MQGSERQVYGSIAVPTSLWVWGAQRLSGILLGPLVLLHILGVGGSAGRGLDVLLLIVIVVHGYVGIRRIRMKAKYSALLASLAAMWLLAILVFGGLALIHAN